MTNNQNEPREFDIVLGGEKPPPLQGAVLGGIEGVKQRLSSSAIKARVAALNEALNYGDAGLDLVINALQDVNRQVRRSAYLLLRGKVEAKVKQALEKYKTWNLSEPIRDTTYPHQVRIIVLVPESVEVEEDPDNTSVEEVKASLRRALQQASSGQRLPLSQMWVGIDTE